MEDYILDKTFVTKGIFTIFYGLGGPEPGGQVGLPLPHLPEGVHCGALLVVPQPREVRGEGAGGVLPVYVLLWPQLIDLQGQVPSSLPHN